MSVDVIEIGRAQMGSLKGSIHNPRGRLPRALRVGDVMSLRTDCPSSELHQRNRTARSGRVFGFEHQEGRAFPKIEARTPAIKRATSEVRCGTCVICEELPDSDLIRCAVFLIV